MITHLELRDSIIKTKITLKKLVLKNNYEISKYALKEIIQKWSDNETILNMHDRIKELELENGTLMSEINELVDVATKFIPKKSNNIRLGEVKLIVNNLEQRNRSLEILARKHQTNSEIVHELLTDIVSEYNIDLNVKEKLCQKRAEHINA